MTEDERRKLVERILGILNKCKVRATYSAVGCILEVQPQAVGEYLGCPRREASWVVAKTTNRKQGREKGKPTGYKDCHLHPDLFEKPMLTSCRELRKCLDMPPATKHRLGCDG